MKKETIMLVEDQEIDIKIVQKIMSQRKVPIELDCHITGEKAMEQLRKTTPAEMPKLILLDLNMPVMDGFEFLESYQHEIHQKRPQTRIVVLTSSFLDTDKQRAIQYKFVEDYWQKPFGKTQLDQLLKLLGEVK